MRSRSTLGSERRSRRPLRSLLLILIVAVLAAAALAYFNNPAPEVAIESARPGIGRTAAPVTVRLDASRRGLTEARVELVQNGETTVLAERTYDEPPRPFYAFWGPRKASDELVVEVGHDTVASLEEGEATLRAVAERAGGPFGRGEPATAEVTLPVRLRPPVLSVISNQHYVAQGGSGVVVYRVGDGALTEGGRDGVRAGDWFFPGHPLPGGGEGDRFALFGVPWNQSDPSGIRLVAADALGNESEAAFVDRYFPKAVPADTIHLSDGFMQKVVAEILGQTPGLDDQGDLLENYLMLNGELRKKNAEELVALSEKSREEFLWDRSFQPMAGGQVMSAFAQDRTYVYDGEPVDHQVHLGFDLATVERDAVQSAANGVVVLARYFGIYGNTVVVDHGYGLATLYSHLSSIGVQEGQDVSRGQELGRTGATGLAGGDHLHYTVMINGRPVSPVEWWDQKWINDRLKTKLGDALKLAE